MTTSRTWIQTDGLVMAMRFYHRPKRALYLGLTGDILLQQQSR